MQPNSRWIVLAVVSSALLLIVVDMTVLYTALPTLSHDLQATATEKLWIVNAYALTVAGLLPLMGALSDRHGPRLLFLSGLVVFGLASLLAAYSPSASILIGARVVLAVGAAMMMPATLAIIRVVFEDPSERSFAIGVWAAVASGGAAFGPVLGGVLLEFFWWGSVFLINVPIVVLALVVTIAIVPQFKGDPERRVDMIGSVQVMVGLVAVIFAIKEAAKGVTYLPVAALIAAAGLVFLVLFARRQLRSAHPMIDFALFRNPVFSAGVIAALFCAAALLGMEFAVSQELQLASGLSPLQAGLTILPIPLSAFFAGPTAGLIMPRVGAMRLLWIGLAGAGLGIASLTFTHDLGGLAQIASFVVTGASLGATMTAASAAILLNAPANAAGAAASVEEVSYELGGAIGVAILGGLLSGVYSASFVAPDVGVETSRARDSFDGAILLAQNLGGAASDALLGAARTAFSSAFEVTIITAAALLIAAALAVAISTLKSRNPNGSRTE